MANLTTAEMAAALDLSASLVGRYHRQGMPMGSATAARAWVAEQKTVRVKDGAEAAPIEGGYLATRIARERAEAQLAEIRVLEARRNLANMATVRDELARRLSGLRESLLQIPSRLQSVLAAEADEAKCHDLIQDELYAVLNQFVEAQA